MLAIVDFGTGNLASVSRACEHVGLSPLITSEPDDLKKAHGVILPGVGAFGDAMGVLKAGGMDQAIRQYWSEGKPLLGICLGLQLLFDSSAEGGSHTGLGLLPGTVRRLEVASKVPNVGWRSIQENRLAWTRTLLDGVSVGEQFYFVHSYAALPHDDQTVLCTTAYGGTRFASGVARENITAFQFHPERSGPWGLNIYANFARAVRG